MRHATPGLPRKRLHPGKCLRISEQRSVGRGIAADDHQVGPPARGLDSLELLGGIAVLAVKPEIGPPLLQLDRSDAEDRPSTTGWSAQAAHAGLEVAGWQLSHPVVHPDYAIGYPGHQLSLRHRARDCWAAIPVSVSPPPGGGPARSCASSPTSPE